MGDEDGSAKLSAGYYGPKGSQKLTSIIISRFSSLLRKLSTTDPLISSGGGGTQFVQMVLVPELTVCLVKQDMGVDEEEARVIMRESENIGALVNGEENEAEEVRRVVREREMEKEERKRMVDV